MNQKKLIISRSISMIDLINDDIENNNTSDIIFKKCEILNLELQNLINIMNKDSEED